MKTFVVVLALLSLSVALRPWKLLSEHEQYHSYTFEHYKLEFNRSYAHAKEEALRKELFHKRLAEVKAHNQGKFSWTKAINRFSDRTEAEYKTMLGLKGLRSKDRLSSPLWMRQPEHLWKDFNISAFDGINIDWRSKGVITQVKDQGACGSCWTFATAETVESYNALKNKQLLVLSEQQILDCTPNPNNCGGTGGCGGGTVELAVTRIAEMGGLSTEASYPYISGGGSNYPCSKAKFKPVVKVANYVDLPSNTLAPVIQHIATTGPLAISVDASAWSDYGGGVFDGCNNANPDLDHAVQLVGMGTDPSYGDYWLVRNSWGPDYGEDGYIRIKRFSNPPCGIDTTPSDGDGCSNGPPQVKVCGNCGILYDTTYVIIQ